MDKKSTKKHSIHRYGEPHAANALTGVRAVVIEHHGFARMASCLNWVYMLFVQD